MVAFYLPQEGFSLEPDYLIPLGLGNCTLTGGHLQADDPLTEEQIQNIEAAGFKRADINWYEISPEPARSQNPSLLRAFREVPSTTIRAENGLKITISLIKPLDQDSLKNVRDLGFNIEPTTP